MKILYFSTVNWNWIKQRPHFIAYYMSIEQINTEFFSITPYFKQNICRSNVSEYFTINDKYVLPLASKLNIIKMVNKVYIKGLLNKNYDIVILTHPEQYGYLPKKLKMTSKIIYECMDNMPYFYNESLQKQIINQEKELCYNASRIITSSDYLKTRITNEYRVDKGKIKVIKNAVDTTFLDSKNNIQMLKHPNLMYIGTISEWIDIDNINKFAKENPEYTIYLIGPIASSMQGALKNISNNILLVGAIPHEIVKSYIQAGDAMLIPFKVNELIKGVDPVKMYEYLALNKSVITTYWEELSQYKANELVHFYSNYNEFKNCVYEIDKSKNINRPSINIDFINQNNWQVRVKEYLDFL